MNTLSIVFNFMLMLAIHVVTMDPRMNVCLHVLSTCITLLLQVMVIGVYSLTLAFVYRFL